MNISEILVPLLAGALCGKWFSMTWAAMEETPIGQAVMKWTQ